MTGLEVDNIERPDIETVDDSELLVLCKQQTTNKRCIGVTELSTCHTSGNHLRVSKKLVKQCLADLPMVYGELQAVSQILLHVHDVLDRISSFVCGTVLVEPHGCDIELVTILQRELEVILATVNRCLMDLSGRECAQHHVRQLVMNTAKHVCGVLNKAVYHKVLERGALKLGTLAKCLEIVLVNAERVTELWNGTLVDIPALCASLRLVAVRPKDRRTHENRGLLHTLYPLGVIGRLTPVSVATPDSLIVFLISRVQEDTERIGSKELANVIRIKCVASHKSVLLFICG